MDFATEFRAWRDKHHLNRQDAADALCVPVRTLQGWETGRDPQWPGLIRLAMARVDDIVAGAASTHIAA